MRKIIIDTDTASDDSVAIIMALRSDKIKVEALTVVAGNVPIDIAVNNALVSVQVANTYDVPVYAGASKPLVKDLETGQFAHGQNGMGEHVLPVAKKVAQTTHAVDAMVKLIKSNPHEIDLMAIGPLTNVALAIQKAPEVMKLVKGVYIMGGNGFGEGNMTDYAEYNYYVDAEAVKIVSEFYEEIVLLPWNTCDEGVRLNQTDIDRILALNTNIGQFIIDIQASLLKMAKDWGNEPGFVIADAGVSAILIDESIALEYEYAYLDVEIENTEKYGMQYVREDKVVNNYKVCTKFDNQKFMDLLIKLIS